MAGKLERALRHVVHPLVKHLETSVHPLRYLFVEITQRCNLDCLHCGSDCGVQTQLDELSVEEWLTFFDYLRDHVDTRSLILVITGGEPLMHPELDRILARLGENGLTWGMVTNGVALTPRNVERLMAHGMASVTVSLDGLEGSHDWLRNSPGTFQRVVGGLERLQAAGVPFFDVVTCVSPRNVDELPQVEKLLVRLGVPGWRLFSIFPKGRAKDNTKLLLEPAQYRAMMDFIADARRRHQDDGFDVSFSCEGYLPSDTDRSVRDEPYFCRAGVSIGSVLADGAICACPNISRSLIQGNIREDDFVTVWEKRFLPFRERAWMRSGPCTTCSEWSACQGNSMHLWDDELGHTALCTFEAAGGTVVRDE